MVAALSVIVGPDPFGAGAGAVSAGDRPAVLSREVQIRPGDAEDAAGGGKPGRSGDAGPPAAGGGGRGPAAGVGGALPGRCSRAARSSWRPATARRPTNDPRGRQSAGRAASADVRGPAVARPGAWTAVRSGDRRDDRPGGRGRVRRSEATANWPGCWSWARSAAACPTKTKRWPSSARSARSPRWRLHSADIQQTLESLNQELRDKVDKIAEQQRRILILQDQLRDRAERERAGSPAASRLAPIEPQSRGRPRAVRVGSKARARPSGR